MLTRASQRDGMRQNRSLAVSSATQMQSATEAVATDRATMSPLRQTVAHVQARVKYAQITLGAEQALPENGWYPAAGVVDTPAMVSELVDQVGKLYEMDDRQVSASFLILGYFWYPWAAAIACYLLDQRVPQMDAPNVALSLRQGVAFLSPRCYVLPGDPLADHPDAIVLPDREALRAQLAQDMTETHATPLFRTLRSVAPYGIPAMRANYVDRMASAILWLCSELGYEDVAQAEVAAFVALVAAKSRTSSQVVTAGERGEKREIMLLRSGCCLNYRRDDAEHCEDCSLLPLDERISKVQTRLLAPPEAHDHDHDHEHAH